MKKEYKELLLKDLCARLPYGMFVHHKNVNQDYNLIAVFDDGRIGVTTLKENIGLTPTSINECKPYLRPMSSMTEEERKEFDVITNGERGFYEDEDGWIRCDNIHTKWGVWPKGCAEMLDWLKRHHFDYRGLIEKGLALEAPEGMYKTE